jgi:hypothetical protein
MFSVFIIMPKSELFYILTYNPTIKQVVMLSSDVVRRKRQQNKTVITKDHPEGQKIASLADAPRDFILFNYSDEPIQKQIDDWFREKYPLAFKDNLNRVFTPKHDEVISVTHGDWGGFHIAFGNQPIVIPLKNHFDFLWKHCLTLSQDIDKQICEGKIAADKRADLLNEEVFRLRAGVGIHEHWHGVHRTVFCNQLCSAYPDSNICGGVDEILSDNNMLRIIYDFVPVVYSDNDTNVVIQQIMGRQLKIIDDCLSGLNDIEQTKKAISDLLCGKHPVTGAIMNLNINVRNCLNSKLSELKKL